MRPFLYPGPCTALLVIFSFSLYVQRRSRAIFQFRAKRGFYYHSKAFTKNRLQRHTTRIRDILLKRVYPV
ncbi:hypothetical protein [Vibrio phage vB_VpS_C2]|nr:hypothetical protein [Vibrio phage vB_VpS_C2]